MRIRTLVAGMVLAVVVASPRVAHADTPFFSFTPGYSEPIVISSYPAVAELLMPQNDYLGGIEFWVSTSDTSGTATFTLFSPQGVLLATKTVAVPAITDTAGGQPLRADFPTQVAVTGNAIYRIEIQSDIPTLRLYAATSNELLVHTSSAVPVYTYGVAKLGDAETDKGFKVALYERSESRAPIIGNVAAIATSATTATVTFTASEPVDWSIAYGPQGQSPSQTTPWTGQYTPCLQSAQPCSQQLAIQLDTSYAFELHVRDVWGNTSTAAGTFDGLASGATPTPAPAGTPTPTPAGATPTPALPPDTTAPVITNARVALVGDRSVTVVWTTNEAANSDLFITTPDLLSVAAVNDPTLELEHTLIISGRLTPNNNYLARIRSADAKNNEATAVLAFNTLPLGASPVPPAATPTPGVPAQQQVTPTPTPALPTNSPATTIAWSQQQSASGGYRVDVFDSQNNLIRSVSVPSGSTSVELSGIPDDARAIVYAQESGIYQKVPATLSTRRPATGLERVIQLLPYALFAIAGSIILAAVVVKFRKKKAALPGQPLPPATLPPPSGPYRT